MSFEENVETNWARFISWILFQISLGFGVGLVAAIAALFASGHEPDFPLSGWLVMSPTWLLPIAVLALVNLRRVASAKARLNVTLFLFAAFAGEFVVLCAIAAADHA